MPLAIDWEGLIVGFESRSHKITHFFDRQTGDVVQVLEKDAQRHAELSADRRYVTLNVDASVAKIEGFQNTPVTAVAGGQLVNSATTQSFIQRPTTTVTRVQTSSQFNSNFAHQPCARVTPRTLPMVSW